MWQATLDRDIGDRIHRLIAACVAAPERTIASCLQEVLAEHPVSGARAVSVRMQLASAAGTFRRRFVPAGAQLIGCEAPIGFGIADLIWEHDGIFAIDELKSGSVDVDDVALADQVLRFLDGGQVRWGRQFTGVRVVSLTRPARTCFVTGVRSGQLTTSPMPTWLEVR